MGSQAHGLRISALLLYAGAVLSARDALHWFGHIRGGTRAGVTIPSQIRWIAMPLGRKSLPVSSGLQMASSLEEEKEWKGMGPAWLNFRCIEFFPTSVGPSVCWSGRWPRWPKVRDLVGGHSAVAERSNSTGLPAVPALCGAVETFGSQRERAVYASGGVSSEKILEAWNSRMNIQYPGVG